MTIFFLLFLFCGILHELQVATDRKRSKWMQTVYSIGAVWFLFWEEPYILHSFIVALVLLSVVKGLMQYYNEWKPFYEKIDSLISMVLIVLLSFYFLTYTLQHYTLQHS